MTVGERLEKAAGGTPPKKRGRPKGSKNKPKQTPTPEPEAEALAVGSASPLISALADPEGAQEEAMAVDSVPALEPVVEAAVEPEPVPEVAPEPEPEPEPEEVLVKPSPRRSTRAK